MNIKRLALVLVLVVFAVGGCMAKAQNNSYVADVQNFAVSGWTADDEEHVWTLASVSTTADADVYVVTVNADVTGTIGANFKVRLKDGGTTKYFGVLSVSAYSGGVTTLYLFGGTDYVLSGTISEFSYSVARSPFGWPMDEDKWAIVVSDSTEVVMSVTAVTWANCMTAIIPAGEWRLSYLVMVVSQYTSTPVQNSTSATLSTTNNSETNKNFTEFFSATYVDIISQKLSREKYVVNSAEVQYYLNILAMVSTTTMILNGDVTPTYIRAVWGGL